MAVLKFTIEADYQKVVELRDEIARLEKQLRGFDGSTPQAEIGKVESQLASARGEFTRLTTEAGKAGAAIGTDFKRRIYDAQQAVNALSAKIIEQKAAVRENENAVKALGEAHRKAVKRGEDGGGILAEYKAAKHALDEDRYLLSQLTTEQDKAKLSVKSLREEYSLMGEGDGKDAIEELTGKLGGLAATVLGGIGIKEFVGKVVQVRGEFEDIETKLRTMLGSEEKMRDLMGQLKDYALISPLTTKDMSGALQMMIGFGIDADKSVEYLKALGDISMGNTQSFNSLALAFSQMSAAGKLMGQDLNQMINAGFNPLQTMSEKTGKSIGELKKEMSSGAITAEMVQQAFLDATSAGGKFHGMAEAGAKTINGQISMLEESFDNIFNDIGTKSEGIIIKAISGATSLVESYETIGKVLATVAATYGTYRAAVLLNIVATQGWTAATSADTIAKNINTAATKAATVAQAAFNAVAKANPYVLLATVAVAAATAIWAFSDSTTAAEKEQRTYNNSLAKAKEEQEKYNEETRKAIEMASDDAAGTKERADALNVLVQRYPSVIQKYIDEKGHLTDIIELKKEIARLDGEKGIQRTKSDADDATRAAKVFDMYRKAKSGTSLSGYGSYEELNKAQSANLRWAEGWYKKQGGRVSVYGGDSYSDMYEFASKRSSRLKKEAARATTEMKSDAFTAGIGDFNDKQLGDLVANDQKMLEKFKGKVKYVYDKFTDDYLTESDVRKRLTKAQGMQKARSERVTDKSYWENLKKQEEDKLEKLSNAEAAGKKGDAIRKKIAEYDEILKKSYSTSTGSGGKSGSHDDAASEAKSRAKAEADLEKEMATLRAGNEKEEIAAMEDGHAKRMRELDQEHEEELRKVREQAEKIAKLNGEAKTPDAGQSVTVGDSTISGLTQEQADELNKSVANAEAKRVKDAEEVRKSELEAMRAYLKEYGTLQQQRVALIEEWDEKIAKAEASGVEGDIKSAKAGKQRALVDFDFEALQKSPEYARAFGDTDITSTGTLQSLLAQFETAMQTQAIDTSDPEVLQRYVDIIEKLNAALSDRNPFDAMRSGLAEVSAAAAKKNKAQQQLTALEAKGLKGTEQYAAALKEYNEAEDEELKGKKKVAKAVTTVTDSINELGDRISSLGNTIGGTAGDVLGLIGNIFSFVTTTSEAIKTISTATATAMSTIEKASAILAIIQAAIQLMQALSALLPDAYAQYEKYAAKIAEVNKLTEAVDEYRIAVAEAKAEENNWFSGTTLRSLKDYAEVGKEALDAYNDKLYEAQATYQNKSGAGWLTKTVHWVSKAIDAINPLKWASKGVTSLLDAVGVDTDSKFYKTLERITDIASSVAWKGVALTATDLLDPNVYEYEEGQTAAIDNLRIETRKASKGFLGSGIGGKSQKTEDLRTWTKENLGLDLFDEDNNLNVEVADTILENYGDKLVGETKETLEYLKEMQEKYDEWKEQLEEYVSELYNPVIENFTDALWDWLDEGKDALASFKDYASDTFRDIVTDMLNTIMLSDFLDQYSDTIKDLYEGYGNGTVSYAQLIGGVIAATDTAMDTYNEKLPVYQELLSTIYDAFGAEGIDLSGSSSSQDSTYGEVSSITQEQASEISGRLTAVQESGYQRNSLITLTNAKVDQLIAHASAANGIADGIQDILAKSLVCLQSISDNTEAVVKPIRNISDKMDLVEQHTKNL